VWPAPGAAARLGESLDVGAKEITPRIFSEIIEFSGGKLTDDIALLALSRT